MKKTISVDIVIDNHILAYGNITIEFTGDGITEEIATAGINAMDEHLKSYRKAVGVDGTSGAREWRTSI